MNNLIIYMSSHLAIMEWLVVFEIVLVILAVFIFASKYNTFALYHKNPHEKYIPTTLNSSRQPYDQLNDSLDPNYIWARLQAQKNFTKHLTAVKNPSQTLYTMESRLRGRLNQNNVSYSN
ncbi:MAG: hypothetical protein AB7F64_02705 [Gammaproteobacteria bacterium]